LSSAILRAERNNSVELISAIRSQISNALAENASGHNHYTLTVDVIEHRSFFTLGNWNALTRLKWRVQQGNGSILRESVSLGEGHRSNMAGYLTAAAVSQDSFNVAMADLMSSLSAIPTGSWTHIFNDVRPPAFPPSPASQALPNAPASAPREFASPASRA
jgi:hypothetical protein